MKSKYYMDICLILFVINITSLYAFKCGADKMTHIKVTKVPATIKNKENRKLSTEYQPIQIKYDYTYLDSQSKDASTVSLVKDLLEQTATYFQKILSVKHEDYNFTAPDYSDLCQIPKISNDTENWSDKYDLVIIPYFNDNIDTSVQAAASPCVVADSYFPKVGVMMLNPNLAYNKENYKRYFLALFLHEISHIMIYHTFFFSSFELYDNKVENNEIIYYINSRKVIEKAKLHFQCDTLEGIPLENQGGDGTAGTHWEARYMLGDYMISIDYPEIVISDISLALFEDSGIYKVNYYTGGLFRFGKGEGCEFFSSKCIINQVTPFLNEFCSDTNAKCTTSHLSRGYCYKVKFTKEIDQNYRYFSDKYVGGFELADFCPVSFEYNAGNYNKELLSTYYFPLNCVYGEPGKDSQYGEVVGNNSLCFESSLVPNSATQNTYQSICYKVSCDKSSRNLIVYIGNSIIRCPKEGGKIENPDGYNGIINCPDYNLVCTSQTWCNDMLDCIDKGAVADTDSYIYDYDLPYEVESSIDDHSEMIHKEYYLLFLLIMILF